jgi:hypothetical protein
MVAQLGGAQRCAVQPAWPELQAQAGPVPAERRGGRTGWGSRPAAGW